MSGDLWGLGGRSPKVWGGDGPCLGLHPPNIWDTRYRNMELFWKHVIETSEGLSRGISGKARSKDQMTKKRSSGKFWSKNGHSEIWLEKSQDTVAKWFLVPQTQGQVSAHVCNCDLAVKGRAPTYKFSKRKAGQWTSVLSLDANYDRWLE